MYLYFLECICSHPFVHRSCTLEILGAEKNLERGKCAYVQRVSVLEESESVYACMNMNDTEINSVRTKHEYFLVTLFPAFFAFFKTNSRWMSGRDAS